MVKQLKKIYHNLLKFKPVRSILFNTPAEYLTVEDWISRNKHLAGVIHYQVFQGEQISEKAPVIIGHSIGKRFTKNYQRVTKDSFVTCIPGARVYGEQCNIILSPDFKVLNNVSREFGAEGGKKPKDFAVFTSNKKMPELTRIKGKIAVISTCGSSNFHHWNFDILPRFELLNKAGILADIDHYLINYKGLPFQVEGLSRIGIDKAKIYNTIGKTDLYIEAEELFIPSLTQDLGTITPWVIQFLRNTFLNGDVALRDPVKRLYISRKTVSSRKIINEKEVMEEFEKNGFVEFIPENYSMSEVAAYFANAESIASIHGSGLSNLPFIKPGTKVLDILAPYHQDCYYWMMSNQRESDYIGLFAEGDHPVDDLDLVKAKRDDDLLIDIQKLKQAINLVTN